MYALSLQLAETTPVVLHGGHSTASMRGDRWKKRGGGLQSSGLGPLEAKRQP